ncbi:MAG: hypothetical protein GYA52_11530 [Chloroflexi bacterium]|jgi:hypothetical protein|nr:hypothetical protein [Chloroflexota bacterium]
MVDKSKWAKDLGFYMYHQTKENVEPPVWLWKKFTFWDMAVIEPDLFSTTSTTQVNGEEYAMTVDFDRNIFDRIMEIIPEFYAQRLRGTVNGIQEYPVIMQFREDPFHISMRVQLGEITHGDGEDFIPFRVIDVSSVEQ